MSAVVHNDCLHVRNKLYDHCAGVDQIDLRRAYACIVLVLRTVKTIYKGEELTRDYGYVEMEMFGQTTPLLLNACVRRMNVLDVLGWVRVALICPMVV
jgi:hypothetical protein